MVPDPNEQGWLFIYVNMLAFVCIFHACSQPFLPFRPFGEPRTDAPPSQNSDHTVAYDLKLMNIDCSMLDILTKLPRA